MPRRYVPALPDEEKPKPKYTVKTPRGFTFTTCTPSVDTAPPPTLKVKNEG